MALATSQSILEENVSAITLNNLKFKNNTDTGNWEEKEEYNF